MKIKLIDLTVGDLVAGHHNDRENSETIRQMLGRTCNRETASK